MTPTTSPGGSARYLWNGRRHTLLRRSTQILTLLVLVVSACGTPAPSASPAPVAVSPEPKTRWTSGAFLGGNTSAVGAEAFGQWRGRPVEMLSLQSSYGTWEDIVTSQGLLQTLKDFRGLVVLTVPLLPTEGSNKLDDVAAGQFDDVFLSVAKELAASGRTDAIVRVGPIANVPGLPWAATADNAASYRAAARHVMGLFKQQLPSLRTEWDIACGRGLDGTVDRTAALTSLYPGDLVTDVVGCVHSDAFGVRATPANEWDQALRLRTGVGLADVADFARERKKQLAVPDWGLSNQPQGGGDDPVFITRMHDFFVQNADILAFESYYDDPLPPRNSALWNGSVRTRNPRAAEEYRRLWVN